jgi:hypothetical protein
MRSSSDAGVDEPVYNLRAAEYHAYFVGDEARGFAVWAKTRAKGVTRRSNTSSGA